MCVGREQRVELSKDEELETQRYGFRNKRGCVEGNGISYSQWNLRLWGTKE